MTIAAGFLPNHPAAAGPRVGLGGARDPRGGVEALAIGRGAEADGAVKAVAKSGR